MSRLSVERGGTGARELAQILSCPSTCNFFFFLFLLNSTEANITASHGTTRSTRRTQMRIVLLNY